MLMNLDRSPFELVALLFVLWGLAIFVYRLILHPLHKFPGPLLAKTFDIYGAIIALTQKSHLIVMEVHKTYGSVLRTGPDKLTFNSIEAVTDIYHNPRLIKSRAYLGTLTNNSFNVFNVLDTDAHRRKRKIVSQPIDGVALKQFEPTILEQVDIFIQLIRESSAKGEHVNMSTSCQRLGIDIVGYLAFGFTLNLQTEETYRFMPPAFDIGRARINIFMQYPPLTILNGPVKYLSRSKREKLLSALRTMISERSALDKKAKKDFYSFAAGHLDEGSGDFENSELWAEATFFITAGGTPPATAMCALLFYITQNPSCYTKLVTEIRSAFRSGQEIKGGAQLSGCKYLRACIDEALRLAPPTVAPLWREQDPADKDLSPIVIDVHVVPKGTHVSVSIYSLHHNEKYFPDAFAFKPERWIDADSTVSARMNKAFVPFITGPRSCTGKGMTYLEIGITIAKLCWFFDFKRAPGALGRLGGGQPGRAGGRGRVDEYQIYDIFGAKHDGPNLVFHARDDASP
ncbi:cytochrome P450 [Xylariomycetidae sp. FL2044]|nr:cytochrome P450 [Xylariomycetidae sp. FL2044]